jgi:hypothetical protein
MPCPKPFLFKITLLERRRSDIRGRRLWASWVDSLASLACLTMMLSACFRGRAVVPSPPDGEGPPRIIASFERVMDRRRAERGDPASSSSCAGIPQRERFSSGKRNQRDNETERERATGWEANTGSQYTRRREHTVYRTRGAVPADSRKSTATHPHSPWSPPTGMRSPNAALPGSLVVVACCRETRV